jgi:hypothetical protein
MGAIMAAGILDAGGRNAVVALRSRAGFFRRTSVIGLAMFTQYWYWHPLTYFLGLAFQPAALLGVAGDLRVPRFELDCGCKPSTFAHPEPLTQQADKQVRRRQRRAAAAAAGVAQLPLPGGASSGAPAARLHAPHTTHHTTCLCPARCRCCTLALLPSNPPPPSSPTLAGGQGGEGGAVHHSQGQGAPAQEGGGEGWQGCRWAWPEAALRQHCCASTPPCDVTHMRPGCGLWAAG